MDTTNGHNGSLCRLCLTKTMSVFQMYAEQEEGDEAHPAYPIREAIKKFFDIEIKRDDLISSRICINCWNNVDNFQRFHRMVMDKQIKLRNIKVELEDSNSASTYKNMTFENEALIDINNVRGEMAMERDYKETGTTKAKPVADESSIKCDQTLTSEMAKSCATPEDLNVSDFLQVNIKDLELDNIAATIREPSIDLDNFKVEGNDETSKSIGFTNDDDEQSITFDYNASDSTGSSRVSPRPKRKKTKGNQKKSKTGNSKNRMKTSAKGSPRKKRGPYKMKSDEQLLEEDQLIASHMKMLCDLCVEEAPNFAELQNHFREKHGIPGYASCCSKKLITRSRLLDHIKWHKDPECFKCQICGLASQSLEGLRKHNVISHKNEEKLIYQCDQCDRKYSKMVFLNKHKLSHEKPPIGSELFECENCHKTFTTRPKLNFHQSNTCNILNDKLCELCGETRKTDAALREHMIQHDPELKQKRRVQCDVCQVWYANKTNLKKHMREVHLKPECETYKCEFCGKEKPTKSALKRHIYTVHNKVSLRHECNVCHKIFNTLRFLREHMSTHTGEYLYHCQYCPKQFQWHSNYHTHRKKEHPVEWERDRFKKQYNIK